jgi:hypothetical protein
MSPTTPQELDDKTLGVLNRVFGDYNPMTHFVKPQGDSRKNIWRLDLPSAPGAEYFFSLWFFESGERQISAQLLDHGMDGTYFWYRPLEVAEFRGSENDLVSKFCEELEALLTHETRIVQRKGWLVWHFHCEYRKGEEWKDVYGHSAFRGGRFKPPHIKGRIRIYHSAPITNAEAALS